MIKSNSHYCKKCAPKHKLNFFTKVNIPEKKELLELIKTSSFVEIGHKYGVSDNTVRKWCKKFKIPSTKVELKSYLSNSK